MLAKLAQLIGPDQSEKKIPIGARAQWTKSDWIKEADYKKRLVRLWRGGGKIKEARRCELAAAKAEAAAALLKSGL